MKGVAGMYAKGYGGISIDIAANVSMLCSASENNPRNMEGVSEEVILCTRGCDCKSTPEGSI